MIRSQIPAGTIFVDAEPVLHPQMPARQCCRTTRNGHISNGFGGAGPASRPHIILVTLYPNKKIKRSHAQPLGFDDDAGRPVHRARKMMRAEEGV
jgi:hypothetical protein